jgi:transposase-like protein
MGSNALQAGFMKDEAQAFDLLVKMRWPNGPVCPFCQGAKVYRLVRSGRLNRETGKRGPERRLLKCGSCKKQYSPTVGTIMEDSHLPLTLWMNAIYFMASSKKGMSAHYLHRTLGVTYKTAWFLAHRIRHAMKQLPMGKLSGIVEIDETYIGGRKAGIQGSRTHKIPVIALVERQGHVRSFVMPKVSAVNLKQAIRDHVDQDARLMTDSWILYRGLNEEFASHETVNHYAKEYVRGDAHTNTVEGYFSLLKRGITGTFHHVSKHHLHRYLSEFDFRYNARNVNDMQRYMAVLKATEGKRLQYR